MNHMINRPPGRPGPGRQRGAVLLFAALGISALIVMASLIDLGLLYQYRREYQKTADLAALAGAAKLTELGCTDAAEAARQNVEQNLVDFRHDAPVIQTGEWRRNESPGFVEGCDASTNAIRVIVSGRPPALLAPVVADEDQRRLSAQSVARNSDPVASFSVGSRLLRVSGDSTLGALLKGIGLDLNDTTVGSYEGLVSVTITPKGLLDALGIPVSGNITVGGLNALLAVEQVSVGQILDATVQAAGQDGLLAVNVTLLGEIEAKLGITALPEIQLGQSENTRGLFAPITTATGDAALNASVDALSIISTAIGIASAGQAVSVAVPNLLGVTAKVGVVEPPSIGIGGVGTTAYTAQVRVYVGLDTNNIPGLGALLGALKPLVDVRLNLPLTLDVVASKGTVDDLCSTEMRAENYAQPGNPPGDDCPAGQHCAAIQVDADLLNLCIGPYPGGADPFSVQGSCKDTVLDTEVLRVGLLGATLLGKTGSLKTGLTTTPSADIYLAKEKAGTVGSALDLGTALNNLTSALTDFLFGGGTTPTITAADANTAAAKIWNDVGGNACGGNNSSGRSCRQDAYQAGLDEVEALIQTAQTDYNNLSATDQAALQGLGGAIGAALTGVVSGLASLLDGVVGLVSGLLDGVLDFLDDLLGCLTGSCPSDPCLGGRDTFGTNAACVTKLAAEAVTGSTSSNSTTALLNSLLGPIFDLLDSVASGLINTILKDLLGLHLGETDVNLTDLQCGGDPVLAE